MHGMPDGSGWVVAALSLAIIFIMFTLLTHCTSDTYRFKDPGKRDWCAETGKTDCK